MSLHVTTVTVAVLLCIFRNGCAVYGHEANLAHNEQQAAIAKAYIDGGAIGDCQ